MGGADPYHSGSMASAWIKGVQSHKVMTSKSEDLNKSTSSRYRSQT